MYVFGAFCGEFTCVSCDKHLPAVLSPCSCIGVVVVGAEWLLQAGPRKNRNISFLDVFSRYTERKLHKLYMGVKLKTR